MAGVSLCGYPKKQTYKVMTANSTGPGVASEAFPRSLKAVLFDMDGVLFDSMPGHAASWSRVSREFGLPMSPEEAYMHEGRTGESTINILTRRYWNREATAEEVKQIYAAKCREFASLPEAPRMPGAETLLRQIQAAGLTLVVVTGSGQKTLLERLTTHYPGFFAPERIVSSFDVKRGKPAPDPYLAGLCRAGCEAHEAIVVENAPLGVQAARAAGVFTIAVNTGPLPDDVLWQAGANRLFPSMQALSDAWKTLSAAAK